MKQYKVDVANMRVIEMGSMEKPEYAIDHFKASAGLSIETSRADYDNRANWAAYNDHLRSLTSYPLASIPEGWKDVDVITEEGFEICYKCPSCGGDGKETCNNPDHGFIEAMPGETGRLGCPVYGHDPKHKINKGKNTCPLCGGHGHVVLALFEDFGKQTGYDEEPILLAIPIVKDEKQKHIANGNIDTDPICNTDLFKNLKWQIGSIFNTKIKLSSDKRFIEGNPAIHAISKYVYGLLSLSSPSGKEDEVKCTHEPVIDVGSDREIYYCPACNKAWTKEEWINRDTPISSPSPGYWRKRCEAAEAVILYMNTPYSEVLNEWKIIKTTPPDQQEELEQMLSNMEAHFDVDRKDFLNSNKIQSKNK